ncbi:hypothetical protein GFC01_05895 [Desulfofundulus thermobenzoicus]|uniref:Antitoxin n=2 Tax=Desulfofundulus thermobenzoicus TaxID=29376 RepID=A0A6N7IPG8_9FIRM|nr:hypothetical protein [Desulfofundulus thermobenzoicus]
MYNIRIIFIKYLRKGVAEELSTNIMNERDDPVLFSPSQLVSSSKLSKNLGSYLDKAQKKPIFITREQEVEAVLMSLDDYRELLLEEQKAEEIYFAVLAMRRLIEHSKSPKSLVAMNDVLKRFNVTREELAEVPDDEVDS